MRSLNITACVWLSADWEALIRLGYSTALVGDDGVAVMWKGFAARDYIRNVTGGIKCPTLNASL